MRSWQRMCRVAAFSLALCLIVLGCSGPKEEAAKPEKAVKAVKPAAAKAPQNRISAEIRRLMCEAISEVPADAAAVVTLRSPRSIVNGLNASCGPELASMATVPLTFMPAGVVDMDGPVVFILLMQDRPSGVFLVRCQDPDLLKGEAAEEGIIKMRAGRREFHVLKTGAHAAFGDLESLKVYKKAKAQPLAVDKAMGDRFSENLIWVYVNAKPLAAVAKPMLAGMKQQAGQKHPGQPPSGEVKAIQWFEDLLDQMKTVEITYDVEEGRTLVQGRLTLADNAPLLAIAKSMKPIESYEGMLPETDKFLMATWASIDHAQATPQVKAFLRPLMDFVTEKLGEAAAVPAGAPAEGAANPMAALRQAIDEQWALADEYGAAVGNRAAVLVQMPWRGEPIYRLTEAFDLKDSAKYRVLMKKGAASTEKLFDAIMGKVSQGKSAPKMDMNFEYKPDAETIEGLSVDVMQFKFAMQPPPGVPPEVGRIANGLNEIFYGREGLVMRMAVCDNRALAVVGPPEMMTRAIKHQRGKVGDLAKQPPIAAALARVPKGASLAALISCPAMAYAGDQLIDGAMLAALPPARREEIDRIPAPKIKPPVLGEPTMVALVVEGQTIRLEMDMPAEEGTGSVPFLRHAYGRIIFNVFQLMPGFAAPESPEKGTEVAPPRPATR